MPKNLSRHLPTFFFVTSILLTACGQKGALYLTEKEKVPEEQGVFTPKKEVQFTTSFIQLDALNLVGQTTQFNHTHQPSWERLLNASQNENNLLNYIAFDSDILGQQTPMTAFVGYVQNDTIKANDNKSISAGRFLRLKSSSTHSHNLPALLVAAKKYLNDNPKIKRRKQGDFLIASPTDLDLYLAVENK